MRAYITLIIYLLCTMCVTAQIHKVYIDINGKFLDRADKADAYVLIKRLSDSVYTVQKYDIHDTILVKGVFKDSLLTIPNGRFLFYEKKKIDDQFKGILHTDTNTFVAEVGFFVNGAKTGVWTEFERRGVKKSTYTYKGDKLNGLYQGFSKYHSQYVVEDGNYLDGFKEGDWNRYGYDTLKTPVVTRTFRQDKQINEVVHLKAARESDDATKYFLRKLKKLDSLPKEIKVEAIIGVDGEVKRPMLISTFTPRVNAVIMDALSNMPRVVPQIKDGKPEEMRYILTFQIAGFYKQPDKFYFLNLSKEVGNGMVFRKTNPNFEDLQ
ncbi:MAG: hypothetical protein ABJA76_22130 [Mucilaginibacter sp.]